MGVLRTEGHGGVPAGGQLRSTVIGARQAQRELGAVDGFGHDLEDGAEIQHAFDHDRQRVLAGTISEGEGLRPDVGESRLQVGALLS